MGSFELTLGKRHHLPHTKNIEGPLWTLAPVWGFWDDGAAVANVRADARKRSKADDTQSVVVTDEDLRHTLLSPPAVPHRSPLTSG